MPWRTSTVEHERACFVVEAELSEQSFSEVCRRYGISRSVGYKWVKRAEKGLDNLKDQSRRPHSCSHATSPEVVGRILEIKERFGWGAPKIHKKLLDDPAISKAPPRHRSQNPRSPRLGSEGEATAPSEPSRSSVAVPGSPQRHLDR